MQTTNCADCKFCAYDPDGLYCAHEESFKVAGIFGCGVVRARREDFCGPKAILFERADDKVLRARGRV